MSEFWLVSAPGEPTRSATRRNLDERIREQANTFDLKIPELKVGTLDALVQLSDDLTKIDTFAESIAHKVFQFQSELLQTEGEKNPDKDPRQKQAELKEKLAEILNVYGRTLEAYVTRFEWDAQKYNGTGFVRDVAINASQKVSSIEQELKVRVQGFNKLKGNIQAIARKANGSLLIRSLNELVKPENFVLNSEFLVTLLVVVPKALYQEWLETYATLCDLVVPRSSDLLAEDNEYGLFNVTVFRKMAQDFRNVAREKKFIVRDFEFVSDDIQAQKAELTTLQTDLTKKMAQSSAWCKSAFSESFSAWVHVKVLRVFVESVLRYGLPINFETVVVHAPKKYHKAARKTLQQLYAHLDSGTSRDSKTVEVAGIGLSHDYHPYVSFTIDVAHLQQ